MTPPKGDQLPFCVYCGEKASRIDRYCSKCGRVIHYRPRIHPAFQIVEWGVKGRRDMQKKLLLYSGSIAAAVLLIIALSSALILHNLVPNFRGAPIQYWLLVPIAIALTSVFLIFQRSASRPRLHRQDTTLPASTSLAVSKPSSPNRNLSPETIKISETPTQIRANANAPQEPRNEATILKERTSTKETPDLQDSLRAVSSLREADIITYRRQNRRRKLILLSTIVLVIVGAISLIESVVLSSTVFTFIGLGLTFWGLLFMFIRPTRYAPAELVDSTALSSIQVIDRIAYEMGYHGKGIYIPTKGSEPVRVFIPAGKDASAFPSPEKIKDGIFYDDPKGIAILPPGLELAKFFRDRLMKTPGPITLEKLEEELPRILTEQLEIMEDFEMKVSGDTVRTKSTGSVYSDFCNEIRLKTRVCTAFGCPMCSAIACLLVDATGNPIILEEDESTPDGHIIESTYKILPSKTQTKNVLSVEPLAS